MSFLPKSITINACADGILEERWHTWFFTRIQGKQLLRESYFSSKRGPAKTTDPPRLSFLSLERQVYSQVTEPICHFIPCLQLSKSKSGLIWHFHLRFRAGEPTLRWRKWCFCQEPTHGYKQTSLPYHSTVCILQVFSMSQDHQTQQRASWQLSWILGWWFSMRTISWWRQWKALDKMSQGRPMPFNIYLLKSIRWKALDLVGD